MPLSVSTALSNLFNSGATEFLMAELYSIDTVYGHQLRYTSADTPKTVNGVTYQPLRISRGDITHKCGLDVGELTVTIYPLSTDLIGADPIIVAVQNGMLDGATFQLDRAFFSPDWDTCVGTLPRFQGRVSDTQDFSWAQIPITVRSWLELLNVQMPRNVYQSSCRRTLYDTACALNSSSFAVSSSVQANSTASVINCGLTQAGGSSGTYSGQSVGTGNGTTTVFNVNFSAMITSVPNIYIGGVAVSGWSADIQGSLVIITFGTAPANGAVITGDFNYIQTGYFDMGKLIFTSGANNGIFRAVKLYTPGVVTVVPPLPNVPSAGDTFTIYPGCDGQQNTCSSKFGNLIHFSGEPYVPVPESAI